MSLAQRDNHFSLPLHYRRRSVPSGQKLQHARNVPHGVLPWHNLGRGGDRDFQLPQHQEGPGREVQGQREDQAQGGVGDHLPVRGPLEREGGSVLRKFRCFL